MLHTLCENCKGCGLLKNTKFAQLTLEEIEEIIKLEEKLDITLIAYDRFTTDDLNEPTDQSIDPS